MSQLREQAAIAVGWVRAHPLSLALVYLAHALPYLWVMQALDVTHSYPAVIWGNALLNSLLAPTLLLLVALGVRRPWLRLPYIISHHLLLAGAFMLFLVYWPYFRVMPGFYLLYQTGDLPYVWQQVAVQLMGYREWLVLALLGASCVAAALLGRRRGIGFAPAVAGLLAIGVVSAYGVKEAAILQVTQTYNIQGPPLRKYLKIHGFTLYAALQFKTFLDYEPEVTPWPGKISRVSPSSTAAAAFAENAPLNIIILQVESMDKWVIDHQVNGREVMPNLRRIKSQSRYYDNFFAMHSGGGSSDAELAALTSLMPQQYQGMWSRHLAFAPSLPRLLAWRGYYTVALHANTKDFYRRGNGYGQLGFDQFVDETDYSGEAAGWYSKDLEFMRQSWPLLAGLPEPFFAYLINMQSHALWDNYSEATAAAFPGLGGVAGDYIRTMHETDQAIGYLWEALRESGLLERSIVIIYADHPAYMYDNHVRVYVREKPDCIHRDCSPFLIHAPGVPAGVDSRLASHIDVTPTLLDLLGIAEEPETWLGTSLVGGAYAERLQRDESPQRDERKILFGDGRSIQRGPDGALVIQEIEEDRRYIQYSEYILGGVKPWQTIW